MALNDHKVEHLKFKDTKNVIAMVMAAFITLSVALVCLIIFEGIKVHSICSLAVHAISHFCLY